MLQKDLVENVVKGKVLIVAIQFIRVNHSLTVQCTQSQLCSFVRSIHYM